MFRRPRKSAFAADSVNGFLLVETGRAGGIGGPGAFLDGIQGEMGTGGEHNGTRDGTKKNAHWGFSG
jgi:hypothetical protein